MEDHYHAELRVTLVTTCALAGFRSDTRDRRRSGCRDAAGGSPQTHCKPWHHSSVRSGIVPVYCCRVQSTPVSQLDTNRCRLGRTSSNCRSRYYEALSDPYLCSVSTTTICCRKCECAGLLVRALMIPDLRTVCNADLMHRSVGVCTRSVPNSRAAIESSEATAALRLEARSGGGSIAGRVSSLSVVRRQVLSARSIKRAHRKIHHGVCRKDACSTSLSVLTQRATTLKGHIHLLYIV